MTPPFLPSRNGFRFANAFPSEPLWQVHLPFLLTLGLGDASFGLCGGMCYAACDYARAGLAVPEASEPPEPGTPLYDYLVRRQVDSLGAPEGLLKLWQWLVRDDGPQRTWTGSFVAARPGPVVLVRAHGLSPALLPQCHQVVCYRVSCEPECLRLYIYDPNHPGDDTQTVTCYPDRLEASDGVPLFGLYAAPYTPCVPPGSRPLHAGPILSRRGPCSAPASPHEELPFA